MLGVEEKNRPVQRPLLVQKDLRPGDLLRAESVQAQLRYRCRRAFFLTLAVRTALMWSPRLEELDASSLRAECTNVEEE